MPNALKRNIALLGRRFGVEIKRWRPVTPEQAAGDDPLLVLQKVFATNALEAGTILDIGANQGDFTQHALEVFPRAQVYSFEPTPGTFAKLRERFAGEARVHPVDAALSDADGEIEFHVGEDDVWNSILDKADTGIVPGGAKKIRVRGNRLDTFARSNGIAQIDVLKVDVQGAEMLVLNGAGERLTNGSVRAVMLEVNFASLYESQAAFKTLSRFFYDRKYWLHGLYGGSSSSGMLMSADALYLQESLSAAR